MMVEICYAPSSVLATISFMNGKGVFCTSWKQVERIMQAGVTCTSVSNYTA